MDIIKTSAMPCPLRQVGISSTVYWKPTFIPIVAKNLPVRKATTWRVLISEEKNKSKSNVQIFWLDDL